MIRRPKPAPKKKGGQINELLRAELARMIEEHLEIPGILVTVTHVDCSPDLNHAKIMVSVLPEKYTGTILEKLRKYTAEFSKTLLKTTRLRHIPRLNWQIDNTEVKAAEIDKILNNISQK